MINYHTELKVNKLIIIMNEKLILFRLRRGVNQSINIKNENFIPPHSELIYYYWELNIYTLFFQAGG